MATLRELLVVAFVLTIVFPLLVVANLLQELSLFVHEFLEVRLGRIGGRP